MNDTPNEAGWEEEFRHKFQFKKIHPHIYDQVIWHIEELLATAIAKARREGKMEAYREMNHEQQKLLDGFAHSKDCEMCLQEIKK